MFATLIEKELKAILLSPKFPATFGVCALLILLSVFIGIREFDTAQRQYEVAGQLLDQELSEATSWWAVQNRAFRTPDPMQVFVAGVNNDVGRFSTISRNDDVKLRQSPYSDDPLFAIFRFIDLAFIVQVVLSLFAILFTYDAINGEREQGTLKLAFSNAVPRARYVAAKFAGSWLGLTVPLLIPLLLAVLLVMVMGVPMEGSDWGRFGVLMGASVLYFTFFIALSLLVSALTRTSNTSFLVLLVLWVTLVLIVPRASTMTAAQLVSVQSTAELEAQRDRFATDARNAFFEAQRERWEERTQPVEGLSQEERMAYFEENRPAWQEEDDELRAEMEASITEHGRRLGEQQRNQKREQEELAFLLSRFSPASAFQLTAMNLAGTNTSIKTRYEDAMQAYRDDFAAFAETKRQEERERQMEERRRQGGGFMFFAGGDEPIDASEIPEFVAAEPRLDRALQASVVDLGLLMLFTIGAFAGAFVAFVRYDVR